MHPLADRFLDFLYPATCHLCEIPLTHGSHLCSTCAEDMHFIEAPFCTRCGESYDGAISSEFICPNCHQLHLHFEFALAALHSDGGARQLVHDFKYMRQIQLATELAQLAQRATHDTRFTPYLEHGIIVPVPLHWMRQKKRRFNQAEEIGKKLSPLIDVPWMKILKRRRNTETQTRFSRKKRLENLNDAFAVRAGGRKKIAGKLVILLDDVFTTGSTANECAEVLMRAGAERVAVLTVLRG